jgi:integration host factor subunit beta
MIRSDLARHLVKKHKVGLAQAECLVDAILEAIASALHREERVEIRGLGAFSIRRYRGHAGRNPKTGTPIEVKPKRLPHFRPSKTMSHGINRTLTRAS